MSFDAYETSAHDGSKVELYLFETEDGLHRWAYTTDRKSIFALGVEFVPETISRSELKQNAGEAGTEKLTINIPFDNPVAVIHVPYLPPRPIRVTVYAYQRRDLSIEIKQGFIGFITSFSQKGVEVELQCSQIIDTMQQMVPWAVFKEGCVHATYEEGCGVDRNLFRTETSLSAVGVDTISSPDFALQPDGWFTAGYVTNPTNGETRFVTKHVGDTLTLVFGLTGIQVGDTVDAFAGDDHTEATCRLKFNNKLNYLAFDHFPNYNIFEKGTT